MKRAENVHEQITPEVFVKAAKRAAEDHLKKMDVKAFMTDVERNCEWLYCEYVRGTYERLLAYRKLEKTNTNGKRRNIDSPSFVTRVFQYVFLEIIEPLYYAVDPNAGLNCKPEHGITAKQKKNSVLRRMKNIYYDKREFGYALILDQRKCYEHITVKVFRRKLRRLVKDEAFVDFAVNVCFVNGHLPVGTPTSPLAHHIVMLPFDLWLNWACPYVIRYADDDFIPCRTVEEAQTMKWRIKNVWWYELGIRAKRGMTKVLPMMKATDFCGYVVHRNKDKTLTDHNKGYASIRRSTLDRAHNATDRNWGSYFGIMQHADVFNEMLKIEKEMDLRALTQKIKIDRAMDAPSIMPKELADKGIVFTIYDYELRKDAKGVPNWLKCLIGFPEVNDEGEPTGREVAREYHGQYMHLIAFHIALEKVYTKKEILPITNCELLNSCGYIYKDSTNQITYLK